MNSADLVTIRRHMGRALIMPGEYSFGTHFIQRPKAGSVNSD